MSGVVSGRFDLIDQISSGGAGAVWRAWDRRASRLCAAKLMRTRDATTLVRVVREQGVRLAHPHVCSPYAWVAEDDLALIASELLAGGSLLGLVRDHGAVPWRYAAELVAQLLSALWHVHEAGLVHRDVKPANVLLEVTGTGPPRARLADFGIAHPIEGPRITQMGVVIGTRGYLAPEVLAGSGPEPAQDVFAAGVVAAQLLTGSEDPVSPAGPAPDGVPADMWRVATLLCTPDPLRRPAAAAEATRLLRELRTAHPLTLPAHTASGDPLEVFDVLGPLPA